MSSLPFARRTPAKVWRHSGFQRVLQPFAGPTRAEVGWCNRFQQVPRPGSARQAPSCIALCRHTSQGWVTQQIPTSSTAHVCMQDKSQKQKATWQAMVWRRCGCEWVPWLVASPPRLDNTTNSNEFHGHRMQDKLWVPWLDDTTDSNEFCSQRMQDKLPEERGQPASGWGLTPQQIPMSSAAHCGPNNSQGWTAQRIPMSYAALVCNTKSGFHCPLQAQHQPRLDDGTDSNEFRGPRLQDEWPHKHKHTHTHTHTHTHKHI